MLIGYLQTSYLILPHNPALFVRRTKLTQAADSKIGRRHKLLIAKWQETRLLIVKWQETQAADNKMAGDKAADSKMAGEKAADSKIGRRHKLMIAKWQDSRSWFRVF